MSQQFIIGTSIILTLGVYLHIGNFFYAKMLQRLEKDQAQFWGCSMAWTFFIITWPLIMVLGFYISAKEKNTK